VLCYRLSVCCYCVVQLFVLFCYYCVVICIDCVYCNTATGCKPNSSWQIYLSIYHYTSHRFTYLHPIPTSVPLLVTTFLILYLNVFSLLGKDASKLAGNRSQLLMVLFTKECLPTSVLCFLVLIFRLWSSILNMVLEVYPLSLSTRLHGVHACCISSQFRCFWIGHDLPFEPT